MEDYESPLNPSVTSKVTGSQSPYMLSPSSQNERIRWVSASSTGGFHFPVIDDHSIRYARAVETLQQQHKIAAVRDKKILHYDAAAPVQRSLSSYEVNGRRFVSGLKKVSPAEGERRNLHWLYSRTSREWDILSHANR
jgi:hypothetical protein